MRTIQFARSVVGLAALLVTSLGEFNVQADEKPPQPVTIRKVVSAQLKVEKGSLTVTAVATDDGVPPVT